MSAAGLLVPSALGSARYASQSWRAQRALGPVGTIYFAKTALRGQAATLERLRVDRQLQEALAHGPDPLHLAAMSGLDPKTAIRYAENARMLQVTAAEQQDPA